MGGEVFPFPPMPLPNVPTKTALGHDELRLRKHGLGQRYRTILLLVDGRRPLAEVLSLAQQAGSQTSHFEELVRLGMVDVPADAAAPEPVMTEPGALDALRVTDVEVTVPVYEPPAPPPALPAPTAPAEPEPRIVVQAPLPPPKPPAAAPVPVPAAKVARPASAVKEPPAVASEPARSAQPPPLAPSPAVEAGAEPDLISSSRVEALAQLVGAASTPRSAPSGTRKTPAVPKPPPDAARIAKPTKAAATVKASQPVSPPPVTAKSKTKPTVKPKADGRAAKAAAVPSPPASARPADSAEETLVGEVRELLRQTLHYDPPSFGSKLYSRVSHATTVQELVDLAWEFERQPNHARRSRAGMWTLQHARELLGLGNTLVQDSWEQDGWQDTRPPADSKG